MNSDFRLFGEWVTVKIIDGRGEGRRGGEGRSVDMRIFRDRMCLKEWTEKHLLPRPPPPPPPQKKRRERLQVRRNRMCESLIQKPWEFIHLGTRNFSQSESLRILLLWKALQAVLWLTWFLIATGGELLVILFISRDFTQSHLFFVTFLTCSRPLLVLPLWWIVTQVNNYHSHTLFF